MLGIVVTLKHSGKEIPLKFVNSEKALTAFGFITNALTSQNNHCWYNSSNILVLSEVASASLVEMKE